MQLPWFGHLQSTCNTGLLRAVSEMNYHIYKLTIVETALIAIHEILLN